MKKHLSYLFFLVLCILACEPALATEKGDSVIRILAIGNSFSEDAVEQNLYEIARAEGIELVIGNLYHPGCPLERHANNIRHDTPDYQYRKIVRGKKTNTPNTTISQALADEDWDYVSVQQASHYSGLPCTYFPYLEELVTYVKQRVRPDTRIMFHMTWAYAADSDHDGFRHYKHNQSVMYSTIVNAAKIAAKKIDFDIIIPSGTAIQNARTSSIGDSLNRDGYHLSLCSGRYTAACTWFESIFGISCVGNPYTPCPGLSAAEKDILQRAAHAAARNPFVITPIADRDTMRGYIPCRGDLVFTTSTDESPHTDAIAGATATDRSAVTFTHVGILDIQDGEPCVIEATSKTDGVTFTPWSEFISMAGRVSGRPGIVIKRIIGSYDIETAVENARKQQGVPYDWAYMPDNGKFYCSELVYECYRKSDGKPLFTAKPMNFRTPDGKMPEFWTNLFKKLGQPIPEGVPGTNPNDMSMSPVLEEVYRFF